MQRIVHLAVALGSGLLLGTSVLAQPATPLPLANLSAFRPPTPGHWQLAGDAMADLTRTNVLITRPASATASGVLVCAALVPNAPATYLQTVLEHGDADLELDFMVAPTAKPGLLLQGRYELRLADSWGQTSPRASSIGGIAPGPASQASAPGFPPRQNAGKAPGLWQHLKLSFQAPRFGPSGEKISEAQFLRVELNGVLVQEQVAVPGPTQGAVYLDEKSRGPLVFRGDSGAVAYRNITYRLFDNARPRLSGLTYTVHKGMFKDAPSLGNTPPEATGTAPLLTAAVSQLPNDFVLTYTGTLHIDQPGEYTFQTSTRGGAGQILVNNTPLSAWKEGRNGGKITLASGDFPFRATYSKFVEWQKTGFELTAEGPGVRQFVLTPTDEGSDDETDPILVSAETNTVLRSFMDLPPVRTLQGRTYRVTHAISVGSPEQVHYTYDADFGSVVQVWRGPFLDATPMWENRGDGSARPTGNITYLGGKPQLTLARLATPEAVWPTDTVSSGFRPGGYQLDDQDRPTFMYHTANAAVTDQLTALPQGHGLRRTLTVTTPAPGLYARLAVGTSIEPMPNNTYLIDGRAYMIRLLDGGNNQPLLRTNNGKQELLMPLTSTMSYAILF